MEGRILDDVPGSPDYPVTDDEQKSPPSPSVYSRSGTEILPPPPPSLISGARQEYQRPPTRGSEVPGSRDDDDMHSLSLPGSRKADGRREDSRIERPGSRHSDLDGGIQRPGVERPRSRQGDRSDGTAQSSMEIPESRQSDRDRRQDYQRPRSRQSDRDHQSRHPSRAGSREDELLIRPPRPGSTDEQDRRQSQDARYPMPTSTTQRATLGGISPGSREDEFMGHRGYKREDPSRGVPPSPGYPRPEGAAGGYEQGVCSRDRDADYLLGDEDRGLYLSEPSHVSPLERRRASILPPVPIRTTAKLSDYPPSSRSQSPHPPPGYDTPSGPQRPGTTATDALARRRESLLQAEQPGHRDTASQRRESLRHGRQPTVNQPGGGPNEYSGLYTEDPFQTMQSSDFDEGFVLERRGSAYRQPIRKDDDESTHYTDI